eukprot:s945_g2.t2
MGWLCRVVIAAWAFSAEGQADFDFEVWEPVPFRPHQADEAALLARQRSLAENEYWLLQAGLQVKEWTQLIENRSRDIRCRKEIFRHFWADKEVAVLHLMVFRLVQIQATAEFDSGDAQDPVRAQRIFDAVDALHETPRNNVVEVIVCIDNLEAATGDFPVFDVFRASTARRNPAVLVRELADFFAIEAFRNSSTLYLVVLASNAFFNDLSVKLASQTTASSAAETELVEKYRRLLKEEGIDKLNELNVVVATDRVCRQGQYGACKEAQSPYLHASGLLGQAQALGTLTAELLDRLDGSGDREVDLNSLLREYASQSLKVRLVPDRRQMIFGSLTEVIPGHCASEAERGNWCVSSSPCCPISNNIHFLHEAFYGRYSVEECTMVRKEGLQKPVLWSGDGIAKWMYLLALDTLATSCQAVARLVLRSHPSNLLENLFDNFEATQYPGSPRGQGMAFWLSRIARSAIAPLERNIKPDEFISFNGGGLHGAFEIPNYRRAPFWKYFWAQHFVTRQHVFNVHHTGYIVLCVFFWWTGAFSTAPMERREKYYMHSPKFRLQTAYANPGTRPAAKIAQEQAKVRYFYRGHDHAFTLNEMKDFYFKLRENWLIQHYPGIQYPFVHRQMIPEKTAEPLKVPISDPLLPGHGH